MIQKDLLDLFCSDDQDTDDLTDNKIKEYSSMIQPVVKNKIDIEAILKAYNDLQNAGVNPAAYFTMINEIKSASSENKNMIFNF